jgi:alanine-glyoxylate transaminase/serine-glyoxylate transaminase/serine-pyruvate transaminase
MAIPTVGHLDPEYLRIMDDTRTMLQHVFRTQNELTVAMPGTGSAGMETCVANLIEPGDEMIIGVNGVFGTRMVDVAERCGAMVHPVEAAWGEIIDPSSVARALEEFPETRVVGIVHAETSTGAHQPLEQISETVHRAGALLLVDAVTSLGGVELDVDGWAIDACYSGTQKCLSCPPGLAPVTLSDAAVQKVNSRRLRVQSWYLDLTMISKYWGSNRVYHHTAPINMSFALYEALRIVIEEGLEARLERHLANHRALRSGLEAMGLRYIPKYSLPNLNAVHVPDGADDALVRRRLLEDFGIEIGAGLGPFAGKAWRIGIMGSSCTRRHVTLVLGALESILCDMGVSLPKGEALAAANAAYG